MSKERTRQLMEKELDGELTPTERDELERLLRADPSAARQRDAWRRFGRSLIADLERAPALDVGAMTSRVLEGAAKSPRAELRKDAQSSRRASIRAAALGAAALAAAAALYLTATADRAAIRTMRPRAVASAPVAKPQPPQARSKPSDPVEIVIGDLSTRDDREYSPINIRF